MNLNKAEKIFKHCFKEKITVTLGAMVAFMITGNALYAEIKMPTLPDEVIVGVPDTSSYSEVNYDSTVSAQITVDTDTRITTSGLVSAGVAGAIKVTNGATVVNDGSWRVYHASNASRRMFELEDGSFFNRGDITVDNGSGEAIRITATATAETKAYNYGKIELLSNRSSTKAMEIKNGLGVNGATGEIIAGGTGSLGISVTGPAEGYNLGIINVTGNGAKGMVATTGASAAYNYGKIDVTGANAIGMEASGGGTVTNRGTITVNVKDGSNGVAMKGDANSPATNDNDGIIILKDYFDDVVSGGIGSLGIFSGKVNNNGLVVNANGNVLGAAGDQIENGFDEWHPEGVYKADETITIGNSVMNGILNQGDAFTEGYLAKIEEGAAIHGVINAVKEGVHVSSGAELLIKGQINTVEGTALKIESGNSKVHLSGAKINGDIISSSSNKISDEAEENVLNIFNDTVITGNISLGSGNDIVNIDSSLSNFGQGQAIDGGGNGTFNIYGGKNTILNAVVKNFDKTEITEGTLIIGSDGKITQDDGREGSIVIGENSNLVISVDKNSYENLTGNQLSGEGDLWIKLDNKLMSGGSQDITLSGVTTGEEFSKEQINSSNIIYDITLKETAELAGDQDLNLTASIKNLQSLGIDSSYEELYSVITTNTGILDILDPTLDMSSGGSVQAFSKYLGETIDRNPVGYLHRMSYESSQAYIEGIKSFESMPGKGQRILNASYVGSYQKNEGDAESTYYMNGAVVSREWGLGNKAAFGLAAGAAADNGDIGDSDTKGNSYHLSMYGKKYWDNFRLFGGVSYQRNNYRIDRNVNTGVQSFNYESTCNINGYMGFVEGRYTMVQYENWNIEARLGLGYSSFTQNSVNEDGELGLYTEEEAGIGNFTGEAGLGFTRRYTLNSGTAKLAFDAAYHYVGGDNDKNIEASYNGYDGTFMIKGAEIASNRGRIGLEFSLEKKTGAIYRAGYTFTAGQNLIDNKVALGAGYKF